jgi:hypothetical protein
MAAGYDKNVEVKELENGKIEIAYKGNTNVFFQIIATVILVLIAVPSGCVSLLGIFSDLSSFTGGGSIAIAIAVFLVAIPASFMLSMTTHKIEISPEALSFEGKSIPWSEIDNVGYQGGSVYVICSGTRVSLGATRRRNSDIAQSVMDRITQYSPKQFT